jgi:hypothetical protein
MEAAFVLGVIFAFITIIIWLEARRKERMFLLKQGKDPNIIDNGQGKFSSGGYLKWGIIIIFVGLGTLLGTIFRSNSVTGGDSVFIACLMICSGIGIVAGFLTTRNMSPSDKPKEE